MFCADGRPQVLEGRGRAGEVDAGQVGVRQRDLGDVDAVAGEHVDHARRQAGLLEQLHGQVRGELLGRRRLPQHGVAHERRRGRQVAGDRGEVERRDRVDEALERPVVGAVPHAPRVRDRLLGGDLLGVVDVEPPEVDQLAGRVDLGLERGLGLAEHGRGVETLAPRAGEQLGGLEQDGGALVERQGAPARRRLLGRGDRVTRVGLGGTLQHAEHVLVVVGLDDADLGPASHPLLPADGGGQLELAGLLELQLRLELGSFGGTRGVREVRLVQGSRRGRDGVHGPIVSDVTRVAQVPVPSYGGPVAPRLTRRRGPGSR